MSEVQTAPVTVPDPGLWVDEHGDYLFKYAMFRLRDASRAEDAVQETLLAALQAYENFAGRGSERTWLVGILKHKIIDHFRRLSREAPIGEGVEEALAHDELFRPRGDEWEDHWRQECAPVDWHANPEQLAEQHEFWEIFSRCLEPLPPRTSSAFTLREVDGLTSEEICEVLGVTTSNLWVMLHRARLHLRNCIEINWIKQKTVRH